MHINRQNNKTAVAWAVGGAALAAADAIIVRSLNGEVHPFVIAFFRASFGAVVILPWILVQPAVLRSVYSLRQHSVRAFFKLLAMAAFFAAFSWGPLADVTAIAFTSPIFVIIGATLSLGERLNPILIVAVIIGFVGSLLVIGPSTSNFTLAIGLALIGAILQAAIQLILKSMSKGDKTSTLTIWNLLLTVPFALALALPFWEMPNNSQMMLLALQGVVGTCCMAMMTHAFSLAPASVVAPVDFMRLPLVAIGGILLFGEVVALTTITGGALICMAALIASRNSGQKAAKL